MPGIRDLGTVKDDAGRECEVALCPKSPLSYSFWVLIKSKGSGWVKQDGISVLNSEQARDWAKQQLQRGVMLNKNP